MFDFILLGVFAFLIWRVIQAIFTNLQQLFTRNPITITNLNSNIQTIPKSKQQSSAIKPKIEKAQAKVESQPSKQVVNAKPYKSMIVGSNLEEKVQEKISSKQIQKISGSNSPLRSIERSPSLEKQRYQVEQYRFSDLEELRNENELLREKIERFQQQKTSYIAKIQDIIQHIANEQRLPVKSLFDNEEDEEIKALNLLKKELNHVQQSQAERFSNFQREILQKKEKEIQLMKETYEQQIFQLSKNPKTYQQNGHIGADSIVVKLREDNEHKDHQIETLRVSLNQAISLIEQLKSKLESKNSRESLKQEELHLDENGEQIYPQIIILRKRVQELQDSEANLMALVESYQNTLRENSSAQLGKNSNDTSASEALLKVNLESSERALLECQQKLHKQKQRSQNIQKILLDYKSRLQKQKQKSSIFQNDKLQEQIDIGAKLQSLQKVKESLQQQVRSLNEEIFTEQQRRNDVVSEEKAKISKEYEEKIEKLTKDFETEVYQRKQQEKKVLEIQNELQFVQTQLKHSSETEKALNQEISILKNSRKQEKNSTSDVQSHPEYLKIKRKVVELEGQLKNSRMAVSQNESELRGKEEKVIQKINYARTSDRQVSPSFQSTTKDRTPPKPQLPTPNKEKPTQSTIFTGLLDRVSSPMDLRYKTPVDKPVVQTSIYEGGIVSQGYFGETTILNLQQRQFIIQEINHLKKISAKKTRLLYRSLSSKNKNISQYTSNVPNLLVVVQLANKRILSAFTQAAFNKDLNNQATEKKYHSANKAMIIDVTSQRTITNSTPSETIRYDQRALIWGRNEFAVSSDQPLLLTCEINCESAVYPCKYSAFELLGSESNVNPISQFQVYRIFLG